MFRKINETIFTKNGSMFRVIGGTERSRVEKTDHVCGDNSAPLIITSGGLTEIESRRIWRTKRYGIRWPTT